MVKVKEARQHKVNMIIFLVYLSLFFQGLITTNIIGSFSAVEKLSDQCYLKLEHTLLVKGCSPLEWCGSRFPFSDPRSLRSWCIKGTGDSVTRVDLAVSLMHHGLSDLRSQMLMHIIL